MAPNLLLAGLYNQHSGYGRLPGDGQPEGESPLEADLARMEFRRGMATNFVLVRLLRRQPVDKRR